MSSTVTPPLHTSTSSTNHESSKLPMLDPLAKRCRPRRLIETRTLKLVEFPSDDDVPPYAILSHRWVKHEEMSYQEMLQHEEVMNLKLLYQEMLQARYGIARGGEGSRGLDLMAIVAAVKLKRKGTSPPRYLKPGFAKIFRACQQAIKDDLSYIWIDTCCIDSEDHGQQSQDINSMFDYYKNSQVCYVYLNDYDSTEKLDMGCSTWFTRGWTLQELVAPRLVEFFDRRWNYLGDMGKHGKLIASVTGIPTDVVDRKRGIGDVSIKDRMSWSINRKTTKEEDQAYCLLGLLGVTMEPRYGEGAQSAFERLAGVLVKCYPDVMGNFGDIGDGKAIMKFLWFSNKKRRERTKWDL